MWGVGSKGRDSSSQNGVSHTYTVRLDYSRISILYIKIKIKKNKKNLIVSIKKLFKEY